jgi:hypothetical protein
MRSLALLFLFVAVAIPAKAQGEAAFRESVDNQLPDAPSASKYMCHLCQPWEGPTETPLTWRKTFDKKFIVLYSAMFVANFIDIAETVHVENKCGLLEAGDPVPYKASFGDLARRDIPYDIGFTMAGALLRKYRVRYAWLVGPPIVIGKHIKGTVDGYQQCPSFF